MAMNGNPYYEPNYENYYYEPNWFDRWQDPESWHTTDQYARSAARFAGPVLPLTAAVGPLILAGYSAYGQYNKTQKAAEEIRLRKQEDIDDLKRVSSNIKSVERMRAHRVQPGQIQSTIQKELKAEIEGEIKRVTKSPAKSRKSSPIKPVLRKYNIPLSGPIKKAASIGLTVYHQRTPARHLMKLIDKSQSIEAVTGDPKMRKDYPDLVGILEDIPKALESDQPFPSPFRRLLDDETNADYDRYLQEARDKAAAERAENTKRENRERTVRLHEMAEQNKREKEEQQKAIVERKKQEQLEQQRRLKDQEEQRRTTAALRARPPATKKGKK